MHQHIKIGKIVATFGVTGQLILVHNLGKKSTFKNVEALFVEEVKNSFLPYFIKEIKAKNEEENCNHKFFFVWQTEIGQTKTLRTQSV